MFHRLKIEPTSKVEVQYDGSKLVELTKVEDEDYISPPPFSGKINSEDSVIMIKAKYEETSDPQQSAEILFDSAQEKDILETFYNYVQDKDPDIFIFVGDHYASTILDYLFARIVNLGLDLHLGREKKKTIPSRVSF